MKNKKDKISDNRVISQKAKKANGNQPTQKISSQLILLFISLVGLHLFFNLASVNTSHTGYHFVSRIWGFDNIWFYPAYIIFTTYLIVIAVCIPSVNEKIIAFFSKERWTTIFARARRYKYVVFALMSIFAGFVFYYFRIKYHFLGDMDIRVKQTVAGEYLNSEYLTMYVLNKLYTVLESKFSFTGYQTYVLQSVISGSFYVFFALLIADLNGKSLIEKVFTFLSFISIGAILLFFGYVEIYSIPALSVVVYIYFALLWVHNKTNFVLPLVFLALSIGFHLMAIALAPSYIIVLYQKVGKRLPWFNKIKTVPFIMVIIILLPVAYKLAKIAGFGSLMPSESNEKYPEMIVLLSGKHIWEFLNSQILASGMGFFLLIYFTIKGIRRRIQFDQVMWFYSTAAFFMLYLVFVTNKMRGSGDWDICAFPALIYSPMVIYFFFREAEASGIFKRLKYVLIIIIIMNFANTIPWIGINAGDKSIKKIAVMLESDPGYYYTTKLPSLLNLALSYKANGLNDESLACYKKAYIKFYNDPNIHLGYASQLLEAGKEKEAIVILDNLIHLAPYIPMAYPMLFNIYQKNNMQNNIYNIINLLYNSFITNPKPFLVNFKKDDLKNYFGYLSHVEAQKGNKDRALAIESTIQQLQ